MRNTIAICTVAMLAVFPVTVLAAGVPNNSITGKPGNSSAAQDVLGGGQPNCRGDIAGTFHSTNKGPLRGDKPTGQDMATANGNIFFLGSVIGLIPGGQDCSELVLGH